MYHFEQKLRVRYAETDQMGYVYYGNYSTYYEVARVESIRALGLTYKEIEDAGVIMPVLENNSKYIRPAKYDDELTLKLRVEKWPNVRIRYDYDIFKGEVLIHRGFTSLVFVEKSSGKPCQMPNLLGELLKPFFNEV
jgi:acyl-CoA thioester hydrolase